MQDDAAHPTVAAAPRPPAAHVAERGQLAVGLVLVVGALGLALGVVVTVARAHLALAHARAAADAAALAAALDGPPGAHRIAAANGAVVVALVERGTCVEVRVRAGAPEARARARRVVDVPPGSPWGAADPVGPGQPAIGDPPDGECPLPAAPVP
jgi:hypothetical protein